MNGVRKGDDQIFRRNRRTALRGNSFEENIKKPAWRNNNGKGANDNAAVFKLKKSNAKTVIMYSTCPVKLLDTFF